ncbi:MAG: hypothetical protein K6F69_07115 [Treponema sp.]|nr:hypothetical protein [Treponema sp.]
MEIKVKAFLLIFLISLNILTFSFAENSSTNESRPVITNIEVKAVSSTEILLNWTFDSNNSTAKEIYVYRKTEAFTSSKSLENLSPIAILPLSENHYKDKVNDYKNYYYAVIIQTTENTPYNVILPSVNTNTKGVSVSLPTIPLKIGEKEQLEEKNYKNGELRSQPLPYLSDETLETRYKKSTSISVSEETSNLENKSNNIPAEYITEAYIFDEDKTSPASGDSYLLYSTLEKTFMKKNYKKAISDLERFLNVNRSLETTDRAYFYLGECHYFMGNYKTSLSCFLKVEDKYPILCKRWITSVLSLYNIPEQTGSNE